MKKSIFDEQTSRALKKWHKAVKQKRLGKGGNPAATVTLGGNASPSPSHLLASTSSGHALHRFKTTGHSTSSYAYDDHDMSDHDDDTLLPRPPTANLVTRADHDDDSHSIEIDDAHREEGIGKGDYLSFVKPVPQREP